jgi:uncharacterized protein (TIGR02001 family)
MSIQFQRRLSIAAIAAAALFSGAAMAQMSMPAGHHDGAEPDWTFTSNIGLFSQYIFRGVSQTNEKPAVQGGFDLAHKSGFYVGTWASNISWLSDATPAVSASLEWDMYGGYKGTLPADFGYDLGFMYYYYPGSYPGLDYTKPNTLALYAVISWKFLSLRYNNSVGNKTFGFPDSRGSDYVDLAANYDIIEKVSETVGKVTLIGHIGHQRFRGSSDFDYTDWKIGASTEVYGLTVGVYFTDTNAKTDLYTNAFGKQIAKNQFVGFIQKTF